MPRCWWGRCRSRNAPGPAVRPSSVRAAVLVAPVPGFPGKAAALCFRVALAETERTRVCTQPGIGGRLAEVKIARNEINDPARDVLGVSRRRDPPDGDVEAHAVGHGLFENLFLVAVAPEPRFHFQMDARFQSFGRHGYERVPRSRRDINPAFPGKARGEGHQGGRLDGQLNAPPPPGWRHIVQHPEQLDTLRSGWTCFLSLDGNAPAQPQGHAGEQAGGRAREVVPLSSPHALRFRAGRPAGTPYPVACRFCPASAAAWAFWKSSSPNL